MDDQPQSDRPPSWIELESVKPLSPDVEQITSLSEDTLKRRYPEYVIRLSERRIGMKLRHALEISRGK